VICYRHVYLDKETQDKGNYGGIVCAWDAGIQVFSIGQDKPSLATKLNHGKFRANGACGFVPLPPRLRFGANKLAKKVYPSIMTLHIIGGRNIPLYISKKYVEDDNTPELIKVGGKSATVSPMINKKPSSVYQRMESIAVKEAEKKNHILISTKQKDKGSVVVIDLNGTPSKDIQQKTRVVKGHGHNPIWNEVSNVFTDILLICTKVLIL
jgi:hypothetical protein